MTTPVPDSGLARERTSLAWTRTALGLVANGGLVLVRHEHAFPLPVAVSLAGVSLLVALIVLRHALGGAGTTTAGDVVTARGLVFSLGLGVTVLSVGTAAAVVGWH